MTEGEPPAGRPGKWDRFGLLYLERLVTWSPYGAMVTICILAPRLLSRPGPEALQMLGAALATTLTLASLSFSMARALTEPQHRAERPALMLAGTMFATAAAVTISGALLRFLADQIGGQRQYHEMGRAFINSGAGICFMTGSVNATVGLQVFCRACYRVMQRLQFSVGYHERYGYFPEEGPPASSVTDSESPKIPG
jgi:hypothetical protein